MKIDRERCLGCGACFIYCPMQAISLSEGAAEIDRDCCVECGVCRRVEICPVEAIEKEKLEWPRAIRAAFSDPLCIHTETNMAGRGTSEMKTNDVTGRFPRGIAGVALELGRPGMGTRMSEIEKITTKICPRGVLLEPRNPLTKLINPNTGELQEDVRGEKVMSVVIEFPMPMGELVSMLRELWEIAPSLDTVMSVGVACRADEDGTFRGLQGALEEAGIHHRQNVKMNVGLGRPLYQETNKGERRG